MHKNLILKITHCPEINKCLTDEINHPCAEIVHAQEIYDVLDFQVPEPWSGRIKTAPILFISSNPSICDDENFPRGSWSDEDIVDYFQNRFGEGKEPWIVDGTKSLRKDGSYGRATMFWAGVKARARELMEREPVPGLNYALTELVHCKSRQELGVPEALDKCVSLYLNKVLTASGAKVLIGLGALAKEVLCREYNLPKKQVVVGPLDICEQQRMVTFLSHPNAWKDKTFQKVLSEDELSNLRDYIA